MSDRLNLLTRKRLKLKLVHNLAHILHRHIKVEILGRRDIK